MEADFKSTHAPQGMRVYADSETLRVLDSAHTHGTAMRGQTLQRRDSGRIICG